MSVGRSSGAIVAWTSAWTLATSTLAAPDRQAARAATRGRGLVRHQLAALVGEGGPRLEDGDQRGVAEPGAQLLGHPVADLGVARDPADALRVGREGEGRREVRLGAVRDGRQPDVLAVHPGRLAGETEALAQRAERAGVVEEAGQDGQVRDAAAGATGR